MTLQEFVFQWGKKTDHENLPFIHVPLYSWNNFFFVKTIIVMDLFHS